MKPRSTFGRNGYDEVLHDLAVFTLQHSPVRHLVLLAPSHRFPSGLLTPTAPRLSRLFSHSHVLTVGPAAIF